MAGQNSKPLNFQQVAPRTNYSVAKRIYDYATITTDAPGAEGLQGHDQLSSYWKNNDSFLKPLGYSKRDMVAPIEKGIGGFDGLLHKYRNNPAAYAIIKQMQAGNLNVFQNRGPFGSETYLYPERHAMGSILENAGFPDFDEYDDRSGRGTFKTGW